jgi:hypothetical protein
VTVAVRVVVDSRRALSYGIAMATRLGAPLRVLRVRHVSLSVVEHARRTVALVRSVQT